MFGPDIVDRFIHRPDISDVQKALDPAWIMHNPPPRGKEIAEWFPAHTTENGISTFVKPQITEMCEMLTRFDGLAIYKVVEEVPVTNNHKVAIFHFVINPTDEEIKEIHKLYHDKYDDDDEMQLTVTHYF